MKVSYPGYTLGGAAMAHRRDQSLPPLPVASCRPSVLHIVHLVYITDVLTTIFYVRTCIIPSPLSTSQLCLLSGTSWLQCDLSNFLLAERRE